MKLGTYILDHHIESFIQEKGILKRINYENNKAIVDNVERNDFEEIDNKKYVDFKFSLNQYNFFSDKQMKSVLEKVIADLSKIKIDSSYNKKFIKECKKNDNVEFQKKLIDKGFVIRKKEMQDDKVRFEVVKKYVREENMEGVIFSIHSETESGKAFELQKKPHVHIVFPRQKSFGNNSSFLMREIRNILFKYELSSSINSAVERENENEYRILKDRLTTFSWVIEKNERKQLSQYKKSKHAVTLENVEEKIRKYLDMDGSYDFARKMQAALFEKMGIGIRIEVPEKYKKALILLNKQQYKEAIIDISESCCRGEKVTERYKEFLEELRLKDKLEIKGAVMMEGIKELLQCQYYREEKKDGKYVRVFDIEKIKEIKNITIEKLEKLENIEEKREISLELKNEILNRNFLSQNELRRFIEKIGVEEVKLKEVIGKSAFEILFCSLERHFECVIEASIDELEKAYDNENLRKAVENIIDESGMYISKKWKESLKNKMYEKFKRKITSMKVDSLIFDSIESEITREIVADIIVEHKKEIVEEAVKYKKYSFVDRVKEIAEMVNERTEEILENAKDGVEFLCSLVSAVFKITVSYVVESAVEKIRNAAEYIEAEIADSFEIEEDYADYVIDEIG